MKIKKCLKPPPRFICHLEKPKIAEKVQQLPRFPNVVFKTFRCALPYNIIYIYTHDYIHIDISYLITYKLYIHIYYIYIYITYIYIYIYWIIPLWVKYVDTSPSHLLTLWLFCFNTLETILKTKHVIYYRNGSLKSLKEAHEHCRDTDFETSSRCVKESDQNII